MAEQNKTVTIAVIAILALIVIGVGSYFLFSGSTAPPAVIEPPKAAPAPTQAANPEEKTKREKRKRGTEEQTEVKIDRGQGKTKTAEEMTPEEIKEKRGRTDQPRGATP